MSDPIGFRIKIWSANKLGGVRKSIVYNPESPQEIVAYYQDGLPKGGYEKCSDRLVWEPEITKEEALELCRTIEATPIHIVGGDFKFFGLDVNGFEFIKGMLRLKAVWEPSKPNNDSLDRLWQMVDDAIRM